MIDDIDEAKDAADWNYEVSTEGKPSTQQTTERTEVDDVVVVTLTRLLFVSPNLCPQEEGAEKRVFFKRKTTQNDTRSVSTTTTNKQTTTSHKQQQATNNNKPTMW